jgi:hypothetical protein
MPSSNPHCSTTRCLLPRWLVRRCYRAVWLVVVTVCHASLLVCPAQAQARFIVPDERDIVAIYLFNGQDKAGFRKSIEDRAALQVRQVAAAANVEAEEIEKLELAAQGDVKRFFRKVDELQESTKGLSMQNQNDMQKAWGLIQPLQEQIARGLFDKDSLFQRVLMSSLKPAQQEAYREYLEERKAAEIESLIKISVSEIDRSIPLLAKQRRELVRLLSERPRPKTFPEGYAPYVGFVILARVDRADLATFLDEKQLMAVSELQQMYKAYEGVVEW